MALWINQTLHVSSKATIVLEGGCVYIHGDEEDGPGGAFFEPSSRDEANAMAISLRLAAKRLEDIGKGMGK